MANLRLIALAGGTAAAAAVIWLTLGEPEPAATAKLNAPAPVEVKPTTPPSVPEAEIPARQPTVPALPPLPPLDASDSWLRQQSDSLVAPAQRNQLSEWLASSDLLRRSSAYIDGLARGQLLTNIFPLTPPSDRFISHASNGRLWMNAGNYERYNTTVDLITAIDAEQLVALFDRARPLLMAAFSELGYTQRQMDGTVMTALQEVLATPVIVEPIELTRESVAFRYADPKLENLSRLQKQLLRSGPENTQRLQSLARDLEQRLLAE